MCCFLCVGGGGLPHTRTREEARLLSVVGEDRRGDEARGSRPCTPTRTHPPSTMCCARSCAPFPAARAAGHPSIIPLAAPLVLRPTSTVVTVSWRPCVHLLHPDVMAHVLGMFGGEARSRTSFPNACALRAAALVTALLEHALSFWQASKLHKHVCMLDPSHSKKTCPYLDSLFPVLALALRFPTLDEFGRACCTRPACSVKRARYRYWRGPARMRARPCSSSASTRVSAVLVSFHT